MRRRWSVAIRSLILTSLSGLASLGGAPPAPPNILLMVADDLGWMDVSCFGNDRVATPNIDSIARSGVKLAQFYAAAPVCTPTRVSILTGKYPLRFDVQTHFDDRGAFLPECTTLPKLLRPVGYVSANIGKWHLGGVRAKETTMRDRVPGPREHGFDHSLTQIEEQPRRGEMIRERILYRRGGTVLLRDDQPVPESHPYYNGYFTDILAEEAITRMRDAHQARRPFFINLWWMTPHRPYEPAPEPHWSQTAAEGISEDQHYFRSMMARMDYQIGRILKTLVELGVAENTLVIFTSDNGAAFEGNIGPLKGGKGDLHEGGIRVPFVACWPRRIPAGKVSDALAVTTDLLPTLCAAAGASLPADERFDGMNLLPLLAGADDAPERGPVFWKTSESFGLQRHTPKPKPYANEAVRHGKWKLLAMDGQPVELFDLSADLSESRNRIDDHPGIVESLNARLQAWLREPRRQFGNSEALAPPSPAAARD